MTKCYNIRFTGRKLGAIGKFYQIEARRFATSPEDAVRLLYDEYEHISQPKAKEWQSPFSEDTLVNLVMNDQPMLESVAHHANMLVSLVSRAARQAAKANAEWHDDPESPDHWLFHADTELQFPPEVQIKAAAELILYRLRETPAGLNICDELQLREPKK